MNRSESNTCFAVIGGGWAGLSAAVDLAKAGHTVHVYEAARTLGGRARRVSVTTPIGNIALDNGQHILLGAYRACFNLFAACEISTQQFLTQLPLQLKYLDGVRLQAPRYLPSPLNTLFALLFAHGFSITEKLSLIKILIHVQKQNWQLKNDCSVTSWWQDHPQKIIERIWRPLCISALNTLPEVASAQVFLNVLRDSFTGSRGASDMFIPKGDLSALLADQAAKTIENLGGCIFLGQRVKEICKSTQENSVSWQLSLAQSDQSTAQHTPQSYDGVVIATAPQHATKLLIPLNDQARIQPILQKFAQLKYTPIITLYYLFQRNTQDHLQAHNAKFYALKESPELPGQFLFDASHLLPADKQAQYVLYAVVISAATECLTYSQDELLQRVEKQINLEWASAAKEKTNMTAIWSQCIVEKQATVQSLVGLERPNYAIFTKSEKSADLLLAGDYLASPLNQQYPATLEAAVLSGKLAADTLINHFS